VGVNFSLGEQEFMLELQEEGWIAGFHLQMRVCFLWET